MVNWAANFAVSFTFLTLASVVGRPGTFWIYGGIGVLAVVFIARRVPETNGRSLEQIQHQLSAGPGHRT